MRQRFSPITIKKQSVPKSKTHHETSIDDQITNLEIKIRSLSFSPREEAQLQQLQGTLQALKETEEGMKYLNESVAQVSDCLSSESPDKPKNFKSSDWFHSNRSLANLLSESEYIKKEAKMYMHNLSHSRTQSEVTRIEISMEFKQQLSRKIKEMEEWLHEEISQSKQYATNSELLGSEVIRAKLASTAAYSRLLRNRDNYANVLAMIACRSRWVEDVDLRKLVEQRWKRSIQRDRRTDNKSRKDNLIEAEKYETLKKVSNSITETSQQVTSKFDRLRAILGTNLKESQFHGKFVEMQQLVWQIEGSIENYESELAKIDETLHLSRPRTHLIHFKDPELAKTMKEFSDTKQKWLSMRKAILFEYCS